MIRLAWLMVVASVACGGSSRTSTASDAGNSPTDACVPSDALPVAAPVGAPCVPRSELNPQFSGSSEGELGLETPSASCASQVCLIDHFAGRVSCPYGQSADGHGPDGGPGCTVPGSCEPVTVQVLPQCADRTAAEAVYCSCRCANSEGKTDDGATYCTCPSSMTCVQLLAAFPNPDGGPQTTGGAYCTKPGPEYEGGMCGATCDPTKTPCP